MFNVEDHKDNFLANLKYREYVTGELRNNISPVGSITYIISKFMQFHRIEFQPTVTQPLL